MHSFSNESDNTDFAFIGGFNLSIAMVVAPLATDLARRLGPRPVMAIGIMLESAAYIFASFCSQVWHLYLSQGILVGCGIGFIYIPSLPIISQWFSGKRSLANGISASGSGFGGMFFSWTTGVMLERIGLRWTLRVTGLMTLTANSIAVLLIRHRNHIVKPPQLAFDAKLLQRLDVILLLGWDIMSMLGYTATNIAGFLNLGTAVGRPVIGIISDRFRRIDTAAVITLVCGLSCVAFWIPSTSYGLTVFFSIICEPFLEYFGWYDLSNILREFAGLKDLPSLLSLSWMSIILPTACTLLLIYRWLQ
ncbi:major facilitator superfamily domain-containing protein [Phaeosphaeriaceae sp. PMI808]|nr:major facilitator superfamily domain-containing protein [Phaeosphaeriaceae sp. PMI808]